MTQPNAILSFEFTVNSMSVLPLCLCENTSFLSWLVDGIETAAGSANQAREKKNAAP